jgi:hypothetical protein
MATDGEMLVGGYLFVEGLMSIAWSQDQRLLSNIGRVGRMAIGVWLFNR